LDDPHQMFDLRHIRRLRSQQPRITEDGIERAAQLVRDECQELVFGLVGSLRLGARRLFLFEELFAFLLSALAVGDVNHDSHPPYDGPTRIADGRGVDVAPNFRTVLAPVTLFDEETLAVFNEAAVKFGVVWPVVGECNVAYPHFQQFGLGVADHIAKALIDQREFSCQIAFTDARYHLLRHGSPGPLLAFAQRLHGPRPVDGQTEAHRDIAHQLSLVRAPIPRLRLINGQCGFPSLFVQVRYDDERADA